jgi:hypothetical protein
MSNKELKETLNALREEKDRIVNSSYYTYARGTQTLKDFETRVEQRNKAINDFEAKQIELLAPFLAKWIDDNTDRINKEVERYKQDFIMSSFKREVLSQ